MSTLEDPKGEVPEERSGGGEPAAQPVQPPPFPVPTPGADEPPSTWSEAVGAASDPEAAEEAAAPDGDEDPADDATGTTLERGEDARDADEIRVDPAQVRHAPRFARFALVGVVLGLLVALVQTRLASPESIAEAGGPWASNAWGFFGLMSAIFVPIAVLLLCGIALLVDRRSRRGK